MLRSSTDWHYSIETPNAVSDIGRPGYRPTRVAEHTHNGQSSKSYIPGLYLKRGNNRHYSSRRTCKSVAMTRIWTGVEVEVNAAAYGREAEEGQGAAQGLSNLAMDLLEIAIGLQALPSVCVAKDAAAVRVW